MKETATQVDDLTVHTLKFIKSLIKCKELKKPWEFSCSAYGIIFGEKRIEFDLTTKYAQRDQYN